MWSILTWNKLVTEMKLFLDDLREAPPQFDVIARTYEEAIAYLKQGSIEEISLDHDLGTEKTGYDVAKWIEKEAFFQNKEVVPAIISIHSANPVGRKNIEQAIRKTRLFMDGPIK
jgi:hypothetical protein